MWILNLNRCTQFEEYPYSIDILCIFVPAMPTDEIFRIPVYGIE
jgi:hypothetical protein